MRRLHAVALAFFLSSFAVAQERKTYRVPFRQVHQRILVDVEVGGKLATLLLDTGAQLSVRDRGKSDDCELRLALHDGKFALACGSHNFTNAYVQPDVHIDGLLGNDLLSKFSSVKIDYKAGVIEFEK